jgi:hypothetical protein
MSAPRRPSAARGEQRPERVRFHVVYGGRPIGRAVMGSADSTGLRSGVLWATRRYPGAIPALQQLALEMGLPAHRTPPLPNTAEWRERDKRIKGLGFLLFDSEGRSVSAHTLLIGVPRNHDENVVDDDDRPAFPIVAVLRVPMVRAKQKRTGSRMGW